MDRTINHSIIKETVKQLKLRESFFKASNKTVQLCVLSDMAKEIIDLNYKYSPPRIKLLIARIAAEKAAEEMGLNLERHSYS